MRSVLGKPRSVLHKQIRQLETVKDYEGMITSLSGLAVSGLLAFTTLTRSLQLISPNLVASLRSLELVLAFLVQAVITGQPPQTLSWLGGGLILIGNNSNEMYCL